MVANAAGLEMLGDPHMGDPDGGYPLPRLGVMIPAIVDKRDDPLTLGRVQVRDNVFFEKGSDWISPVTMSGGAAGAGKFKPPIKGSVVFVFYPLGRMEDTAYYIPAGWTAQSEVPEGAAIDGDTGRYIELSKQWVQIEDDRIGHGELTFKHKTTGNFIQLLENGDFTAHATNDGKLGSDATEKVARADRVEALLSSWYALLAPIVSATGGTLPSVSSVGADKWKVK